MEEWVVIVLESSKEEAEYTFKQWKAENAGWYDSLNVEEDIIIDTVWSNKKSCFIRYRVKRRI
jgi:hypothetical protein